MVIQVNRVLNGRHPAQGMDMALSSALEKFEETR